MWPLLLVACRTATPEPPLAFVEEPADRPGERLPLVIAVHGYGDRPESFVDVVRRCRLRVRVVAPRGPYEQGEGYSWFGIDTPDDRPSMDTSQAVAAADRLAALAVHVADLRPTVGEPVITGFSQGGILSFLVAVRHPDAFAAAVPVAGMLPDELRPRSRAPAGAPAVRAVHGDADRLIHAADAEATVQALRTHGFDASLETFPGVGHALPRTVHHALCEAIAAAVK